jgi:hypothetical protein
MEVEKLTDGLIACVSLGIRWDSMGRCREIVESEVVKRALEQVSAVMGSRDGSSSQSLHQDGD